MLLTYNNNKNNITNHKVIVATRQPPPTEIMANRSIYRTVQISNTSLEKINRERIIPQRNPIRHYRRQYPTNNESQHVSIHTLNLPGKTITTFDDDCPKCNSNNTAFINKEIYPNNDHCNPNYEYQDTDPFLWRRIGCNVENRIIKPAQTNISQNNYAPSVSKLRERRAREGRGQTIHHNNCNEKQKNIKNNGECNDNDSNEFYSKTHTTENNTTSISAFQMMRNIRYHDNGNPSLHNNCCNKPTIENKDYYICRPHTFPNLARSRKVCC